MSFTIVLDYTDNNAHGKDSREKTALMVEHEQVAANLFRFFDDYNVRREAEAMGIFDYRCTVYLLDAYGRPVCCKDFSHTDSLVTHCVGWEDFTENLPSYTVDTIETV